MAISSVILGCGTFGGIGGARDLIGRGLDATAAAATMDEAVRLGILLWDTAERYAGGASEAMIGAWLSSRPQEVTRHVQIATKVVPPSRTGDPMRRFDRKYLAGAIEASLSRLGRSEIYLYLAHVPCDITPVEEVTEGFAAIVESGRAQRIGCCNIGPDGLIAALGAADRLKVRGFDWVQNSFSLLEPEADRELRAICRERRIEYSPYSPLAGGILAGRYRRGESFPPDSRMALRPDGRRLTEKTFDALDVLRDMAAGREVSSAAIALAWILGHPDCASAVVGPSRIAPHLGHVAEAARVELTPEERVLLERAFAAAVPG